MDENGKHLVYGGNGVSGRHNEYMFDESQIIIGRVGVYCGVVHRTRPKSWVTDNALYIKEQLRTDVRSVYLEWALRIAKLNQYSDQAAQPLISGSKFTLLVCWYPRKWNK